MVPLKIEMGANLMNFITLIVKNFSYQLPWTKSTWMKLVDSGHVLADHSFDHMKDNSGGTSWNAYQNVEQDLVSS